MPDGVLALGVFVINLFTYLSLGKSNTPFLFTSIKMFNVDVNKVEPELITLT
jgi:hypothetical protein